MREGGAGAKINKELRGHLLVDFAVFLILQVDGWISMGEPDRLVESTLAFVQVISKMMLSKIIVHFLDQGINTIVNLVNPELGVGSAGSCRSNLLEEVVRSSFGKQRPINWHPMQQHSFLPKDFLSIVPKIESEEN